MTGTISKLMLAFLLLPLALLFRQIVHEVLWTATPGSPWIQMVATLVMCAFVMIYWLLLWRSRIRWTSRRRVATLACSLSAVVLVAVTSPPAIVRAPYWSLAGGASSGTRAAAIAMNVLSHFPELTILLWVLVTILLWRESRLERMERLTGAGGRTVNCPVCGYNLTGLQGCRCPECGAKFTLDELMASQPRFEGHELEEA